MVVLQKLSILAEPMRFAFFISFFITIYCSAQERYPYVAHHSDEIKTIAFSPDAAYVVSGGWDSKILVHRADSTRELVQTVRNHRGAINTLTFSRDGKQLISGGQDGNLQVYTFDSAYFDAVNSDTTLSIGSQINKLIYGPGMRMLFCAKDDGELIAFDLVKLKPRTIKTNRPITAVAVAVDRMTYFIANESDAIIRQYDLFGKVKKEYIGHQNDITDLLVTLDRKFLISSSKDKTVRIWNILTGKEVHLWANHTWFVTDIDSDPFGQFLVSAGLDGVVNFYDIKSKELLDSFHLDGYKINAVSWSPDNASIAAAAHPDGVTNPSGYFVLPTGLKKRKIVLPKSVDIAELKTKNAERELQKEWDKALREQDRQEAMEDETSSDAGSKRKNRINKKKLLEKTEQVQVTIEDDE